MLQRPWRPLLFPRMMAAAQARLHNLPADGFPAPPGPFLARHLDQLRATIDQYDFSGLAPGLEWLQTHRPPEPARASILHLDLHPLNLIERSDGLLAVIDWTYSDCGDPHADVATTLFIQECFPVDGASVWQRLAIVLGRPLVAACYLRAYRHHRPLDDGRLAYYRAWAALRALARYARCARAGPEVCDTRAALVSHLAPDLLAGLCRYFRRWTGVAVKL
jgi:aminoglycoside phosphotransferase (APT) family kinase protein